MRYCNNCKVTIENDFDLCPLCKKKTIKSSNDTLENDFPMQNISKGDMNKKIARLFVFAFIALIGLNILLNLIFSFTFIWAPYSIVILFYAYLMIMNAMRSYRNIGTIVVINVYMLSIIGFILDMILGFSGWSLDYLAPILILAGIISLVIFIFIKPLLFLNYFIYMLTITFFGIIQLVLLLSNIIEFKVISIIAVFTSIMTIIGMFMFGDKKAKNEFIKRFHF
jgi:hypothetical protein